MANATSIARSSRVSVGGMAAIIETGYTRPADTTQYAAGDVVAESTSAATILTFPVARTETGAGVIRAATFVDSSAEATKPDFDLYLFDTTVVMEQDNAAWAPSDTEMKTCLGVISFAGTNFKTGNGNGIIHVNGLHIPFVTQGGVNLYGIVVARNTYTPVSGEQFLFRLHVEQY